MTDRSAFSDEEWKALAEAPLQITIALVAVGPHRPITMVKEAAATRESSPGQVTGEPRTSSSPRSARPPTLTRRATTSRSTGASPPSRSPKAQIAGVETAVTALAKISVEEATEVRKWFGDIAKAVADASKSITPGEQAVLDRLNGILEASPG